MEAVNYGRNKIMIQAPYDYENSQITEEKSFITLCPAAILSKCGENLQ